MPTTLRLRASILALACTTAITACADMDGGSTRARPRAPIPAPR